ncbi:MFS-type transporter SLC18B1-like [Gadus macrocephalus]|uniref:MFS-type transporter SLC18B1-like n=1 Tax=Gadus macrocephalus TaxID=80720 RepID=UPI0028CB9595|nr:MFS-type transporter SLC18B1-like [Gadus macrocephalus]
MLLTHFMIFNTENQDPTLDMEPTENTALTEHDGPTRSMSRTQIFTLISVASVNFGSMICYSILGPFFPNEAVNKGASQTAIGLIFSCYAFSNIIGALLMGTYIVQIGAKFMLVSGLFVSGGCTIMFGFLDRAPSGSVFIALCFIVRSIDAIGFAAAATSSIALASKVFPNNVATVLGSLEMFTGLGLILGPPLGGWLYQAYGYELPFLVLGCILLLMVPFNIIVMPSCAAEPSENSFLQLLKVPKVLLICFFMFSLSSGLGFLDTTLSLYAIEKFGLSPGYVGLLFLGVSLPYGLSSPVFGFFADKYPTSRRWFLILGGLLSGLCFCFLGPAPFLHITSQLWLLIFMLCVIGFGLGLSLMPSLPEIIAAAHEQGFEDGLSTLGMVSGLFGACWSMGMFYGPMMGGVLTQHLTFEWAATIQGGLSVLAATLLGLYYQYEQLKKRSIAKETGNNFVGEGGNLLA